jgi:WD40 repeat protein
MYWPRVRGHGTIRLSRWYQCSHFEALDHVMWYLYFYRHIPIMCPAKPLIRKYLTTYWAHGTAKYIGPEFGTCFVNTSNADHACNIWDRHSTNSTIHLINGVAVAWLFKTHYVSTLHSTGYEFVFLTTGAQGTINDRDFFSGLGYPIDHATDTMEDNQATIKCILSSRIHANTRHLATHISWLHKMFMCSIIKPQYMKTSLQLSDANTKPLYGAAYQSKLTFLFVLQFFSSHTSKHYISSFLFDF